MTHLAVKEIRVVSIRRQLVCPRKKPHEGTILHAGRERERERGRKHLRDTHLARRACDLIERIFQVAEIPRNPRSVIAPRRRNFICEPIGRFDPCRTRFESSVIQLTSGRIQRGEIESFDLALASLPRIETRNPPRGTGGAGSRNFVIKSRAIVNCFRMLDRKQLHRRSNLLGHGAAASLPPFLSVSRSPGPPRSSSSRSLVPS